MFQGENMSLNKKNSLNDSDFRSGLASRPIPPRFEYGTEVEKYDQQGGQLSIYCQNSTYFKRQQDILHDKTCPHPAPIIDFQYMISF